MFIGHVGAALAIARTERRVNVGAFVSAALLLDAMLWLFVLLGWESGTIRDNFASTHQPHFVFPYSHGFAASLGWSALAGVAAFLWYSVRKEAKLRVAALLALAALSHQTNSSVGCYCAEEAHCHRSVLKALLLDRGADLA